MRLFGSRSARPPTAVQQWAHVHIRDLVLLHEKPFGQSGVQRGVIAGFTHHAGRPVTVEEGVVRGIAMVMLVFPEPELLGEPYFGAVTWPGTVEPARGQRYFLLERQTDARARPKLPVLTEWRLTGAGEWDYVIHGQLEPPSDGALFLSTVEQLCRDDPRPPTTVELIGYGRRIELPPPTVTLETDLDAAGDDPAPIVVQWQVDDATHRETIVVTGPNVSIGDRDGRTALTVRPHPASAPGWWLNDGLIEFCWPVGTSVMVETPDGARAIRLAGATEDNEDNGIVIAGPLPAAELGLPTDVADDPRFQRPFGWFVEMSAPLLRQRTYVVEVSPLGVFLVTAMCFDGDPGWWWEVTEQVASSLTMSSRQNPR